MAIETGLQNELASSNPFEGGETRVLVYVYEANGRRKRRSAEHEASISVEFIAPANFNGEPKLEDFASNVRSGLQTVLSAFSFVDQTAINMLEFEVYYDGQYLEIAESSEITQSSVSDTLDNLIQDFPR